MSRFVEPVESIYKIPIQMQLLQFQAVKINHEILLKMHITVKWNYF